MKLLSGYILENKEVVLELCHNHIHDAYIECSLGFEKKSFPADSDLMIKSGIADSIAGSFEMM